MHAGCGLFYGFAFLLRFVWRLNKIQLRGEQLKKRQNFRWNVMKWNGVVSCKTCGAY